MLSIHLLGFFCVLIALGLWLFTVTCKGAMCLYSQCWYPLKVHCGLKAQPSAELAFKLDKQEIQVFEVLPF